MKILVYDGSWSGLLTAIFDSYELRLKDFRILSADQKQASLFGEALEVYTDVTKAKRVWLGLSKIVSAQSLKQLFDVFLSELPDKEYLISEFMHQAFKNKESPEKNYGDSVVLRIAQLSRMVHREKHRMEAFIRFQLTSDQLFYATVEPDFNVLPLIIRHFKNRYADQRWLIYDLKRKYGIYYNLNEVEEVQLSLQSNQNTADVFHAEEELYQKLWSQYFESVNIKERKNTKLHLQHVPRRYWKHLTEKL
jgi:probable DNA metabolism protein